MNRKEIFELVRQKYGTVPDYPWDDDSAVLRHHDNNKWYGLIIQVSRDKLGLDGNAKVDIINVKCDPLITGSLRNKPGYHPAYHMNKEMWISIRLDGSVSSQEIDSMIAMSYILTSKKGKNMK